MCVVGFILLLTTLTEGSAFRRHARKQLKKPSIPALKKTYPETPTGKYVKELSSPNPKSLSPKSHGPKCDYLGLTHTLKVF